MIKKFKEFINEGMLDKLTGPSEDEIINNALKSYGDEQFNVLSSLIKNDNVETIKTIFDKGVSIDDITGGELIFVAIDYEKFDILDILLKNNLKPNSDCIFLANSMGYDEITTKLKDIRNSSNLKYNSDPNND